MEFIFELILELVFEGSIEASKNNKIPKYIRYPLIILITLFFLFIIWVVLFTGILLLKDNLLIGILIILLGLLLCVSSIIKFKKTYLIKKNKQL